MKESMPSRVQPVQAAQKPVICPRESLLCGTAVDAALDVLLMTLSSHLGISPPHFDRGSREFLVAQFLHTSTSAGERRLRDWAIVGAQGFAPSTRNTRLLAALWRNGATA